MLPGKSERSYLFVKLVNLGQLRQAESAFGAYTLGSSLLDITFAR